MSDTTDAASTPTQARAKGGEKTVWWITFGILTLAIITMLGLWN